MKTECDVIIDLMPLYTDGVCSEKSRTLVEEHCAECESCREKLSAMTAPLPRVKKAAKVKNPLKKTKRHYLRLAAVTALIAVIISVPVCVITAISFQEEMRGTGVTWSSMAAESEMKNFGRLLKNGQYEKALSKVGTVAVGRENIPPSDSRYQSIKNDLAVIYSSFLEIYPIRDIECTAEYRGFQVEGKLDLYLDEKYTGVPLEIYVSFVRDDSGVCYISEAIINCYADYRYYEDEETVSFIHNMNDLFCIPYYPDDSTAKCLDKMFSGKESSNPRDFVYTMKAKAFDSEMHNEIMPRYYIEETGAFGTYTTVDYKNEGYKADEADWIKRFDAYKAEYASDVEYLFSDRFKYVSVSGGAPYLTHERIYEESPFGWDGGCCFRQVLTVNMETGEGVPFSVSFNAKVSGRADTPFTDVVFSENTPEEFKEKFTEMYC